jgi:DNA-binding transcriptional regulator YiaG
MEYKSEIFEVIHQNATDKYMIGAITPAQMREFDEMCLVQEPETAPKAAEPVKMEYISPIPAEI